MKRAACKFDLDEWIGHDRAEIGGKLVDFGLVIRERRRELSLTQGDLADLAQVSERLVRSIEAGKQTVQLDKLSRVLAALGLELAVVTHVPEALR